MDWKGYVEIKPTQNEIDALYALRKTAWDFVNNQEARDKLCEENTRTTTKKVLFFSKTVRKLDREALKKALPLGVSWCYHIERRHVFYLDDSYDVMSSIYHLIKARNNPLKPIYIDNKMASVWSKVVEESLAVREG